MLSNIFGVGLAVAPFQVTHHALEIAGEGEFVPLGAPILDRNFLAARTVKYDVELFLR